MSFHLHVDHPPHKQQEHRRQYGPSRLRRRARRAEARAAANAAIKEHVAVAVNTAEKAVQTETNNDDFSTTFTAEEADQQPSCDFYLSAEQAGHRHVRPPDVTDTFCPDRDFEAAAEVVRHADDHSLQSQNIPQLDGMMYEDPNQPVPPFIRLSRILQNSDQSQTEAEEERRK